MLFDNERDQGLLKAEKLARTYKSNALKLALAGGVVFFLGISLLGRMTTAGNPMPAFFTACAGFSMMLAGGVFALFMGQPQAMVSRKRLEGAKLLNLTSPIKADGVPIGNARMPPKSEPLHTLIEGATGTGKTQILKRMVDYIRSRGDTVVIVDTGYDMHTALGREGDIVLSVFDDASPGWLPKNEIQNPADWGVLAESFIGEGSGEARQWHQMAKALFVAVARGYEREVQKAGSSFDHSELFHLLTQAPAEDLAPFITGTAAAGLADNEKGLANVRMTFFDSLKFWEHLKPGEFSVRNWVEQRGKRPSIFIPYRKRTLPECKTLISAWLDQIITAAVDAGENTENRVWIIIDELSGLGEIPSLKVAVTELRKTGFRVVVGIQNYEQVQQIYGREGAITITNNLSNKVIMRANDGATGERQSKLIGDARFRVTKVSRTAGEKSSLSTSAGDETTRIVLPAEIINLEDLTALVHFAGEEAWHFTKLPIYAPGEWDADRLVEAQQPPKMLPAPVGPPTPEEAALQDRLRASDPITPAEMGRTEGPRPSWTVVDELLRKIGGPSWDGERFRAKILNACGWHPETGWDEGRQKVARAYERARLVLIQTLERAKIEEKTNTNDDKKE